MNPAATSKEAILAACRALVMAEGLPAVNMRSVAKACGVAVGSIYNYYPSKAALVAATVAEVWQDVFAQVPWPAPGSSFLDGLRWLASSLEKSREAYPGFLSLHALSFATAEKAEGKEQMQQYIAGIQTMLLGLITQDDAIRADAFSGELAPQALVQMLFQSMVSLVVQQQPGMDTLLELVRQALY